MITGDLVPITEESPGASLHHWERMSPGRRRARARTSRACWTARLATAGDTILSFSHKHNTAHSLRRIAKKTYRVVARMTLLPRSELAPDEERSVAERVASRGAVPRAGPGRQLAPRDDFRRQAAGPHRIKCAEGWPNSWAACRALIETLSENAAPRRAIKNAAPSRPRCRGQGAPIVHVVGL